MRVVSALSSRLIQLPAVLRKFRFARNHQNRVHAPDRQELDDVVAQSAFAGIHDLFKLGDHRLRVAVLHRKDSDRLSAHPIDVETERGLDRRTALGSRALNEQQIARGVRSHDPRPSGKAVQEFQQGRRGNVLQRHDRHPVTRLRSRRGLIEIAAADGVTEGDQAVADRLLDQSDARKPQRVLQHENHV